MEAKNKMKEKFVKNGLGYADARAKSSQIFFNA